MKNASCPLAHIVSSLVMASKNAWAPESSCTYPQRSFFLRPGSWSRFASEGDGRDQLSLRLAIRREGNRRVMVSAWSSPILPLKKKAPFGKQLVVDDGSTYTLERP